MLFILNFWDNASHLTWGSLVWPVRLKAPCVSASAFFMWIWGGWIRSSCLHSKHVTEWAVMPAPNFHFSIFCLFAAEWQWRRLQVPAVREQTKFISFSSSWFLWVAVSQSDHIVFSSLCKRSAQILMDLCFSQSEMSSQLQRSYVLPAQCIARRGMSGASWVWSVPVWLVIYLLPHSLFFLFCTCVCACWVHTLTCGCTRGCWHTCLQVCAFRGGPGWPWESSAIVLPLILSGNWVLGRPVSTFLAMGLQSGLQTHVGWCGFWETKLLSLHCMASTMSTNPHPPAFLPHS